MGKRGPHRVAPPRPSCPTRFLWPWKRHTKLNDQPYPFSSGLIGNVPLILVPSHCPFRAVTDGPLERRSCAFAHAQLRNLDPHRPLKPILVLFKFSFAASDFGVRARWRRTRRTGNSVIRVAGTRETNCTHEWRNGASG